MITICPAVGDAGIDSLTIGIERALSAERAKTGPNTTPQTQKELRTRQKNIELFLGVTNGAWPQTGGGVGAAALSSIAWLFGHAGRRVGTFSLRIAPELGTSDEAAAQARSEAADALVGVIEKGHGLRRLALNFSDLGDEGALAISTSSDNRTEPGAAICGRELGQSIAHNSSKQFQTCSRHLA